MFALCVSGSLSVQSPWWTGSEGHYSSCQYISPARADSLRQYQPNCHLETSKWLCQVFTVMRKYHSLCTGTGSYGLWARVFMESMFFVYVLDFFVSIESSCKGTHTLWSEYLCSASRPGEYVCVCAYGGDCSVPLSLPSPRWCCLRGQGAISNTGATHTRPALRVRGKVSTRLLYIGMYAYT